MSTLQTQYNQFLFLNPKSNFSFNEWKEWHGNQIEQALIEMMQADEELGLYDEPFRHKVETIPAEEILANRSNAYEFIDFNFQETTADYIDRHVVEAMVEVVKQKRYSEEEVKDIAKQAFILGKDFGLIGTFNEWFETVKKK